MSEEESSIPIEFSPDGRFERYTQELGRGACKRVFKGFDTREGQEVAWNKVQLNSVDLDDEQRSQLMDEIRVLRSLSHKAIMSFYSFWVDSSHTLNFITELFVSGTLRQFRKRQGSRAINLGIIIRWAYQILEGLIYLHAHVPPIIHRDLKCDNIFFNSNSGTIKIGDLGLATAQHGMAVVGTPEFMASEIYDENYDEKIDIYAFGMCILELATGEYPYSECKSVAQIYRKVTQGLPPAALARVLNDDIRQLIEICIAMDPKARPAARVLLKHPLFEPLRAEALHHNAHSYASLSGLASAFNSKSSTPAVSLMSRQIKGQIGSLGAPRDPNPPSPSLSSLAAQTPLQLTPLHQSRDNTGSPLYCPSPMTHAASLPSKGTETQAGTGQTGRKPSESSEPFLLTTTDLPAEEEGPNWSRLADEANVSRVSLVSFSNAEQSSSPQRRKSIQVAALLHAHDDPLMGEGDSDEEVVIPLDSLIQMAAQEIAGNSAAGSRCSSTVSLVHTLSSNLNEARRSHALSHPSPQTAFIPRASSLIRPDPSLASTSQGTSFSGPSQTIRGVIVRVKKCASHRRSKSWMG